MHSIRVTVILGCLTCCVLPGLSASQEPAQFESLLASAQQAQARGDFEAAAGFYRKAVAIHPEIPELKANLGLMYYQTGKDEQAIEAFRQAIQQKPDLFVPNLFLGLEYVKLKRFKDALPYVKRASLSDPTDMQAQLALAQAYGGLGKTRLATASYLRAVRIDPKNADNWFHLGLTYLEQVEGDARILFAKHKDSGFLEALVADNFVEQRAFIQAAEAYKKALASPPFPRGTHAGYGFVLLYEHDLPGAERELNAELASTPGSLMAKLGQARLRAERGATAESAKELGEIWKADANFLRANARLFNAGLPRSKRQELQAALEERKAAENLPEQIGTLFQPGGTGDKSGDLSQDANLSAETSSRSATTPALSAADLDASGRYGECSQRLASHPKALAQKLASEALTRASALDSDSPKLHILLGDLYRQRRFFPDAEQEYRKALALKPEDTGALFGLSLTLLANSDIDGALRLAQAALNKDPDDPEFNAVMGEILSVRHDVAAAEPYLKKGLKTKPELVPHVHALLGRVYAETNRTQQAIAELKLGLPDDKDGRLHYQIARLYLKIGDRDSAKQAFEVSARLRREGLTRAAVAMQQGENDRDSE